MQYWPDDINEESVQSPKEILEEVGQELESRNSRLTFELHQRDDQDRTTFGFQLENRGFGVRIELFRIQHRLKDPYPVVIDPPEFEIPLFLRRKQPSLAESMTQVPKQLATLTAAKENEWVCSSALEFKSKLQRLLASDMVKSMVTNLLAGGYSITSQEEV